MSPKVKKNQGRAHDFVKNVIAGETKETRRSCQAAGKHLE
jgi:hypothetical protein